MGMPAYFIIDALKIDDIISKNAFTLLIAKASPIHLLPIAGGGVIAFFIPDVFQPKSREMYKGHLYNAFAHLP